jgi:hypothetical protein
MRFCVLVIAALVALSLPAGAQVLVESGIGDPMIGEGGTGKTDDGFYVTAGHVFDRRLTDGPGAGPGRVVRCEYWEVHGSSFAEASPYPVKPRPGQLYELRCFADDVLLPGYPTFVIHDPSVITGSAVSTEEIALFAYRSMVFEDPAPVTNPSTVQIVGIPTWLAVTGRLDYPSVSAAAGPVWASVRPDLRDVVFTMPNGDTVRCDRTSDMTLVWSAANGATQTSDCSYTFLANGDQPGFEPLRADIIAVTTWDLYRQTNLQPVEHWWTIHRETIAVPVIVRELQAVIN